jgi:hypothetical protein
VKQFLFEHNEMAPKCVSAFVGGGGVSKISSAGEICSDKAARREDKTV